MFVSANPALAHLACETETGGPARCLSSKNLLRFQAKISLFVSEAESIRNLTAPAYVPNDIFDYVIM
jgi:hypothetical protein